MGGQHGTDLGQREAVRFDAGGEDAFYVPEAMSQNMASVWTG